MCDMGKEGAVEVGNYRSLQACFVDTLPSAAEVPTPQVDSNGGWLGFGCQGVWKGLRVSGEEEQRQEEETEGWRPQVWEEDEEFYKLRPANKANHCAKAWQQC